MSQSVFKCSTWLTGFLQRRGVQQPDQRGLYEYHCSYEEYLGLQQLLVQLGSFDIAVKDTAGSACFVLFCSEWYRREYRSEYGWSWDPIWNVLGYSLSAIDLSKVVPKGLEHYWKRPIHFYESDRRNFLGSLFAEGGLPFQVLREDGSRFYSLFDRVLKQHDQWHLMGYSTAQQVEELLKASNLPQVFSSEASVKLIAQMADQLLALVRDYSLEQATEPVAHLDVQHPRWRELFPLPLDNQTGNDLLNSLLKTATVEGNRRRKAAGGWACRHFWSESQPDVLKVQVSMPAEVIFRLTAQPSTTRFELVLVEAGNVIATLGPGYAVVNDGSARVRLRQREVLAKRLEPSASLSLVAMAGGTTIASIPISASPVALGEVPLGFIRADEGWQLCGQASFNVANEDLLLVLPPESKFSEAESSSLAHIVEGPTVCSFQSIKVQGKTELQISCGEVYRVRTGHATGTALGLELVGNQLPWATKPSLTFLGLPKERWQSTTDSMQRYGSQLYIGGALPGSGVLQEVLGTQYVSIRNTRGDTLLRRKVGILPADFRLELSSGNASGVGSVFVYTQQRCIFQIADESVQFQQIKGEDYTELRLSADGIPPVNLSLVVTPSLIADSITLELPYPSSGCIAFDASGRPLNRDICVDDLLGTRLYLFGRSGVPTKFKIELTLRGQAARNANYSWSYTAAEKPVEISLFSIREQIVDLLSLHSGIDQTVELRVFGSGPDVVYRLRRYAAVMEIEKGFQVLTVSSYQSATDALPEPVLMLLHDPVRSAVAVSSRKSQGVPTGEFELPALVERNGPWLVVPRLGSAVSFRPLFIAGGWQLVSQNEDAQSLQKAVLTFDHTAIVSSFTPVLDAMASNPMHSGWSFLRSLYDNYGYLPLATFEVWKAVVKHTSALCMALFKFEMDQVFLGRIEAEFPVLWEFLPISDIKRSASRFGAFMKEKGIPEETVNGLVSRMLARLGDVFPAYGESVQNYLSGCSAGPESEFPLELFRTVVHSWYHELIRDRSEATWPDFGGSRLQRWVLAQPNSVISFKPEMDFRNAVVYLPIFAAAVAGGKAHFSDVFEETAEAVFFLRQVRNFDTKWFNSVYQYCLLRHAKNQD